MTLSRPVFALVLLPWVAAGAFAQTSRHYEVQGAAASSDDEEEAVKTPTAAPSADPARKGPRVFRVTHPGGTHAEANSGAEAPASGTTITGGGQSLGGDGIRVEKALDTKSSGGAKATVPVGSGGGGGAAAATGGASGKRCPKVGWPATKPTGSGYFTDVETWGYWYSADGYSGPTGMDEYTGVYNTNHGPQRGAYGMTGIWYNYCNGSSQSPWYPGKNGYKDPPASVCTPSGKPEVINCGEYNKAHEPPPAPEKAAGPVLPPLTDEELKQEFCSQEYNMRAGLEACRAQANALLPYMGRERSP